MLQVARIHATPKGLLAILPEEKRLLSTLDINYQVNLNSGQQPDCSLSAAEVVIIGSGYTIEESFFKRFPQCKYIITCTSGFDHIKLDVAKKQQCQVINMPLARADDVAESTILYILESLRRAFPLNQGLQSGRWMRDDLAGRYRLKDKTVGIVGFGHIGSRVLARTLPFEPKQVLICDPYVEVDTSHLKVSQVSLPELMSKVDILTLHCSLNKDNHHLLSERNLNSKTRPMIIINTARGKLICQSALVDYLEHHPHAFACLDVFENEPIHESNPLTHLPNTLLSPHSAGYSEDMIGSIPGLVMKEIQYILHSKNSPHRVC